MIQFRGFCRYFLGFFLFYPAVLFAQTTAPQAASNTLAAQATVTSSLAEASSNTISADHPVPMEPIVVTANRLDIPASQVSSSLSVLTAKDLEQKQAQTMEDALLGVPGLYIAQSGGPGESSSVFIRGANPEATLVMIDGIPVNDPSTTARSYDYLDQLFVDDVRQVEIVRGPQSVLYGSNAMTGVINILTPMGTGPLNGSAQFEGGSYGTFRETAQANGGDAAGHFSMTASRFDTAGYPSIDETAGGTVNNSDQNTTGSLTLGGKAADNLKGDLLIRYSQSRTNLDAFDPNTFLPVNDPDYFADQKQLQVGGRSTWTLGDWEQVYSLSFVDDARNYNATPDNFTTYFEHDGFDGQTGQFSWQNNLTLSPQETLVLGLQGQEEWSNSNDDNNFEVTPAVLSNARTGSLFAESRTNLEDRLFLTLGGRVDDHSQFGSHGTWQLGLAYFVPGTETKLKANYGTGFLAPTLFQLYDPSSGNSALQPETNQGFDVGFEQPLGDRFLTLGATYFLEDFSELIDFEPTGPITGQYFNIGEARTQGVETFAQFKGISNLQVEANYTYLDAKDLQTGAALARRPANQGALEAFYQWGRLGLGSSLVYVGDRPDTNFNTFPTTPVVLSSYVLLNVLGSLQVDDHLKFFARVDNLLNQTYEEIFGYRTSGLSAYGGVKISM
jgi:vitamin B12 transporter